MPIARVQMPDGRVARLEVPEGTSPQQVEAFVFEQVNRQAPKASAATPEEPSALARVGRGMMDVGQGIKQGSLMLKDLFTGGNEAEQYTREVDDEIALYEKGRGPDAGIDWMRIGGNVAATLPAAAIPGANAATLPLRMLAGATQGAAASGVMFTPEGQSKAGQVATGAVVGGVMPAVGQAVKAGAGKVRDLIRGPQAVSLPRLEGELTVRLQQQGIDWNGLTQQAKDALLKDAQAAVQTGGTLDDAMLKNKAIIEAVGAKPTKASLTRAPRDWQSEKNLRGIQGVGDDIVAREQENARALIDYTQKLRSQTGGKASTALEAGESAVKAIKDQDAVKEQAVKGLYDAFRATGAADATVPDAKVAETLGRVADEIGTENIPSAVLNRLKEFGFAGGERTKLLTVNEADKLNRLINNNNPGHGPASLALQRVKSALNEALLEVPGDGSEALLKARSAAAQRFAEQRAGKGITAALDDVSPDRFVKKFVVDADVRDVRAMIGELGKSAQGKQAVADMKGHILDDLLLKATGATNLDEVAGKPFSGVRFGKALDKIPPEKLHLIFKPAELDALRTLQKASKLLTEDVPFSDVNHSKTASALANLFLKIGNTPLLGKIVSPVIGTAKVGMDWVQDANARKQVAEALLASTVKEGARVPLPVYRAERFLPGAAGAAVAGSQ